MVNEQIVNDFMAKIELSPLIKSMSGTIARKKLSDGTTVNYVVTKKNRFYVHATRPRTTALTSEEISKRTRFGMVAKAVSIVRKEMALDAEPITTKRLWTAIGALYDRICNNGKTITPEHLAEMYAYLFI